MIKCLLKKKITSYFEQIEKNLFQYKLFLVSISFLFSLFFFGSLFFFLETLAKNMKKEEDEINSILLVFIFYFFLHEKIEDKIY